MRTTELVLATAILASASGISAGERPTAEDLLGAFQKSVEKLSRVRIECTDTVPEAKYGINGNNTWKRTVETAVIRDASRWKVDQMWRTSVEVDGARSDEASRLQTLAGCEMIQAHDVIQARLLDPDNPKFSPNVHAYLDNHSYRVWNQMGLTRVVFGRMNGDGGLPLWTVMGEDTTLELLPQTETIAGAEAYIVKSRGKYGEHKVWFDPGSGGLPRRIEFHKQNGDLFDDEQIGSRTVQDVPAKSDPGRTAPPPPYREITCRIDNIQIEKKSGVFVITAFDYDHRHKLEDNGKEYGSPERYRLRTIDIDPKPFPEWTFRFDMKISTGQIVQVWENAPLKFNFVSAKPLYEWNEGKIQRRSGK